MISPFPNKTLISNKTASFLQSIKPYKGDMSIPYTKLEIEQEITGLANEINSINPTSIKFDKYDFIIILGLAVLSVGTSFLFNPNTNLVVSEGFGNFFDNLQDKTAIDDAKLSENIIGKFQEESSKELVNKTASLADEVMNIPKVLKHWGGSLEHVPLTNLSHDLVPVLSKVPKAVLAFAFAMFSFSRVITLAGLKIPGLLTLAPITSQKISVTLSNFLEGAKELFTSGGVPFTDLLRMGTETIAIEVVSKTYMHFRYRNTEYSKPAIEEKRNKLLLITNGVSCGIGIGKIAITQNPLSLNYAAVIQCVRYGWKVIKQNKEKDFQLIKKVNLSVLKNQYEMLDTLIVLDKCIYYTKDIMRINSETMQNIKRRRERDDIAQQNNINEINSQFEEYKRINS